MKRVAKALLKPLWKATGPVRRPISARVERYLRRCLTVPPPPPTDTLDEVVVALDFVVRELVRLQDDVDRLRSAIEERNEAGGGISVLARLPREGRNRAG